MSIRVTGSALNDAVDSVRLAESQAAALADERLDDPVLQSSAPGALGSSLQTAVRRLADSLGEREDLQRRMAYEASHDGLTRLANRRAILAHLEQSLTDGAAEETTTALLYIDLDGFKSVNDIHGHHAGDAVLKAISRRLVRAARTHDFAGRIGGDEFVVIAPEVTSAQDAVALGQRTLELLKAPVAVAGTTITPRASISVAVSDGPSTTPQDLLRDADLAAYQAKERGRDRVTHYDEELRATITDRDVLEKSISEALDENRLILHYEPVIEATTGRPISLEALVRWDKPGVGFVGPDHFIPVAEQSDLILDIDRWVLQAVGRQIQNWRAQPRLSNLPVSVNISPRHVLSGQLLDNVQ